MRILLVTARYLPHRGGLETVVYHLAQEFRRAGHDILIVTNRYPRTLPAHEVMDGITVKRLLFLYPQARFLRQWRIDLLLAGFWYAGYTTWVLGRIIRRFKPEVVNLHYLGAPGFFLWLLQHWLGFPWVISLHGGDVDGEPRHTRFGAWLFRVATRRANEITACSQNLVNQVGQLAATLSTKLQVIHNGVDWQHFFTATPYTHQRPYIIAVGQLVTHKGFDLLIRAFAEVAASCPGVDLLIAGEGECRQKLAELIQESNLLNRVHLLGRVDEGTVAALMAGSLFVAMPSYREPFGIVALEGMAAGKRILATPVGGIPEFLPVDVNQMVEPSQADWVDALKAWLVINPKGQPIAFSNQRQAQNFTWERVATKYLEVYSQACHNLNARSR